jgi:hypothetical protein
MQISKLKEIHKEAVYETRSHLKSPMKRSMDHYAKCQRSCGLTKVCTLVVKEKYDPKPLTGMILLDGGAEANRLWEEKNGKPMLRRKSK